QMPAGVPVATMAIGPAGAANAGLMAARILGVKYPEIRKRLQERAARIARQVREQAENP
ncbi:MAG: AIR carboxylase family protein, partial [Clostridia bacterium]